ncbi:uncharacterized protein [Tenebrio molitor]|uniref:uncharacterized protein isoform X3 n=1 Tax=Tenebrio molitor TaxID=7067 RepID=UPI003624A59A
MEISTTIVTYPTTCSWARRPGILPEALETNCGKCTEKQKTTAYRTIKRLQKEYPKIWSQLLAVWDPDEVFVRKFVSSFESEKPSVPVKQPAQSPFLSNRFGENEDSGSVSPATSSPPPPSSTTVRTTTSTTTTTTTTTAATKRTNIPSFVFVTKPPQAPPFTTVGANIQATVSFGTNLVGGIVRSLGTLGTRVVESGTKLANMVISTVLRP